VEFGGFIRGNLTSDEVPLTAASSIPRTAAAAERLLLEVEYLKRML